MNANWRAARLLTNPEEAAAQLVLAQKDGIRFTAHKENRPLVEVQHCLRLAERMVKEQKYEGAKANFLAAKLRLETYRGLVDTAQGTSASELEKEIDKCSTELDKPGIAE